MLGLLGNVNELNHFCVYFLNFIITGSPNVPYLYYFDSDELLIHLENLAFLDIVSNETSKCDLVFGELILKYLPVYRRNLIVWLLTCELVELNIGKLNLTILNQ
jgi:hypothetical protein